MLEGDTDLLDEKPVEPRSTTTFDAVIANESVAKTEPNVAATNRAKPADEENCNDNVMATVLEVSTPGTGDKSPSKSNPFAPAVDDGDCRATMKATGSDVDEPTVTPHADDAPQSPDGDGPQAAENASKRKRTVESDSRSSSRSSSASFEEDDDKWWYENFKRYHSDAIVDTAHTEKAVDTAVLDEKPVEPRSAMEAVHESAKSAANESVDKTDSDSQTPS